MSMTMLETVERALDAVRKAGIRAAVVPLALAAAAMPEEAAAQGFRQSRVDATVADQGGGVFQYDFTLNNTSISYSSDILVDWELPFFDLGDIAAGSITVPDQWAFEIVTPSSTTQYFNNPDGPYGDYGWDYDPAEDPTADNYDTSAFIDPPFVLHFYTRANFGEPGEVPLRGLRAGASLDGFSFRSAYGSAPAPYLGSWFQAPPRAGDPPIPDNGTDPVFFGVGSPAYYEAVPEPASLAALALGAAVLARRRRR